MQQIKKRGTYSISVAYPRKEDLFETQQIILRLLHFSIPFVRIYMAEKKFIHHFNTINEFENTCLKTKTEQMRMRKVIREQMRMRKVVREHKLKINHSNSLILRHLLKYTKGDQKMAPYYYEKSKEEFYIECGEYFHSSPAILIAALRKTIIDLLNPPSDACTFLFEQKTKRFIIKFKTQNLYYQALIQTYRYKELQIKFIKNLKALVQQCYEQDNQHNAHAQAFTQLNDLPENYDFETNISKQEINKQNIKATPLNKQKKKTQSGNQKEYPFPFHDTELEESWKPYSIG